MTRWIGWILAVPLAWEALAAAGWIPWPIRPRAWLKDALVAWRGLLAAVAGPLALIAFMLSLPSTGLPSLSEAFSSSWHTQIAWPWHSVVEAMRTLVVGQGSVIEVVNLAMLFLFLGLTVASARRLRPSWFLYALCSLVFFLLRDYPARQLYGTLRYLLVLFPCFVTLALWTLHRRWVSAGLTITFGLLQVLFVMMFARWLWVP
jgi:hypothetical protein